MWKFEPTIVYSECMKPTTRGAVLIGVSVENPASETEDVETLVEPSGRKAAFWQTAVANVLRDPS